MLEKLFLRARHPHKTSEQITAFVAMSSKEYQGHLRPYFFSTSDTKTELIHDEVKQKNSSINKSPYSFDGQDVNRYFINNMTSIDEAIDLLSKIIINGNKIKVANK